MKDRYRKIIEESHELDFEKYAKLAQNPREKMRFVAFAHLKTRLLTTSHLGNVSDCIPAITLPFIITVCNCI